MSLKTRSGAELQAAKQAAAERFLKIATAIKAEAGVTDHRVLKGLYGRALAKDGIICAPEGRTRKQLYILAHECGHVALRHSLHETAPTSKSTRPKYGRMPRCDGMA